MLLSLVFGFIFSSTSTHRWETKPYELGAEKVKYNFSRSCRFFKRRVAKGQQCQILKIGVTLNSDNSDNWDQYQINTRVAQVMEAWQTQCPEAPLPTLGMWEYTGDAQDFSYVEIYCE